MPLSVVLVSTRNPLNIGAAARAMANFGCADMRVVNPYDVAFREARSAVGAAPLLAAARSYSSVADAVATTTVRPCWIFSSWESEVLTRDQSAAGRENGGAFRVAVRRHNFFWEHFPGPCLITTCKEPFFALKIITKNET